MSTAFISTPTPSSPPSSLPSLPSSPTSSFSSLPSSLFSLSVPSSPPPSPPPTAAPRIYQSYHEPRRRIYREGDDISHSLILPSLSLGRTSDSEKESSGISAGGRNVDDLLVVGQVSFVNAFVDGLVVGRRARAQRTLYVDTDEGNRDPSTPRIVAEGKEGNIRIFGDIEAEWGADEDESKATCIAQTILKMLQSHRLFTALILIVSSPPTPLETAVHALIIPHIPVLPVFSPPRSSHIPRSSSRRRDTITTTRFRERPLTPPHVSGPFKPLTPRELRHTLFRRKGVLESMRAEAVERRRISDDMGLKDCQFDSQSEHYSRDKVSTGPPKRHSLHPQSHVLDPLHVSSLMLFSFSLLRKSARRMLEETTVSLNLEQARPGWWLFTAAAFFAGVGVGWMWANI